MATVKKSGLGRGLSALLEDVRSPSAVPQTLAVDRIVANVGQPRRRFEDGAMRELTESIAARGLLQPILVRPIPGDRFEIVAGERRWRAAQAAGLHEIPVLIRDLDEAAALEIAIVENVQRADLNAIEEAEGYRRLIEEFGHTQDAVGKIVGKSRSHVANLLRLLDLAAPVREAVIDGSITMGHARAMIAVEDPVALMHAVIDEGLSVRDTEARAAHGSLRALAPSRPAVKPTRDPDLASLEKRVGEALGLAVQIAAHQGAGQVTIAFDTLDQLDLVCARLSGGRL